ncbi:bifunctional diguanylate cyclase/phosphodiesterase [Rhodococcus sp. 14-2470-1a]|uniref:putative bifunctional diguanylate cyclase/phosphodiesterase n=1 Tax=Rhodococcus sp. 14-2470-1a TaxID=2023150 RepID=UPI000B9C1117|nr:GGDEF domain-containing protein [Rhodococcus sp. 14-2470-1a]OZF50564.1 hypothetical protein CH292_12885 [Rhodococcus sp. 14-2470-1a]
MSDPTDDLAVLQAILDLSPDLIALSEFSGEVLYVNPAGRSLVGLDHLPDTDILTTDMFFTVRGLLVADEVEASLKTQGHWRGLSELRHHRTDVAIPVAVSAFVIESHDGIPGKIATIIRDRSAGKRRDKELQAVAATARQHAAEQQALAELSRLAVHADLAQLMSAAALAAATLLGVESAAVVHQAHAGDATLNVLAASRTLSTRASIPAGNHSMAGYALQHNIPVICPDITTEDRFDTATMESLEMRSGAAVPVPFASSEHWGALAVYGYEPRMYSADEMSFLAAVASVVTSALKRVELDRQLWLKSMHDALTSLPNRTLAYEFIDDALMRNHTERSHVALLLLDIDDFKIINDSLGHESGDRALVRFSERLTDAVGERGTVARLGGDEFLIMYQNIDGPDQAEDYARHIISKLSAPLRPGDGPIPMSVSIGIALSEPSMSRRDLIHRADLAMYRAKDSGDGGYALFDRDDLYDADRVRSLSIDLRNALAAGDLRLHYQPLIQISTGKIVAVEALARWNHPERGPIEPTEFVAVAERTGLATALGSWALRTACAQAVQWRTFSDITIRVNVSALQLRNSAFPDDVAAVLRETGLPPEALGLEITETVWVSDTARVSATLAALGAMGVALLLDDLGKGYGSIAYLDRYPTFECLKIDRSYIAELPGERAEAVVSAIVMLAIAFDVTVVGEGVENQAQYDALAAAGCHLAQGFHLGRPVDAERTTALLRQA